MSELTRTIALLYRMTSSDESAIESDLIDRRKAAFKRAIADNAKTHGCRKAQANDPRREDLDEIKRQSREDARSIAQTWNREVEAQIERIYADNPRANRYTYIKNLEAWARNRDSWKARQIALYTEQSTSSYATDRFRSMNGIRGQLYKYEGAPPVSRGCVERTAAGIVDQRYVDSHPVPNHPNCGHSWQVVNPVLLDCEEIWLG